MKATTFILRQHAYIRQRLALLDARCVGIKGRTDARKEVEEVAFQVLSFLAIEEDLFYPVVALILEQERDVANVRDDLARVEAALLGLLGANDVPQLRRRIASLLRAHSDHARDDLCLVPLIERSLGERQLDDLGGKMARFYEHSVSTPLEQDEDEESASTLH